MQNLKAWFTCSFFPQYFSVLFCCLFFLLLVILRIFCTLCTFFCIKNLGVNVALGCFGANPELTLCCHGASFISVVLYISALSQSPHIIWNLNSRQQKYFSEMFFDFFLINQNNTFQRKTSSDHSVYEKLKMDYLFIKCKSLKPEWHISTTHKSDFLSQ